MLVFLEKMVPPTPRPRKHIAMKDTISARNEIREFRIQVLDELRPDSPERALDFKKTCLFFGIVLVSAVLVLIALGIVYLYKLVPFESY